ncbi:MAG: glycosyltransferase, partial [Candidatus Lernaella stagnicola]|nr:glycosyltransferase [Candidatus Lernaella stagnicola]
MKIQFVITGYLPDLFGGAEVYTQNLAQELIARGHDVSVAALDMKQRSGADAVDTYQGVKVHRLSHTFDFRPPPFYALQFYSSLHNLAREFLAKEKPDVIHVTNAWFMMPFAFAALELGIPVVGTHVDFIWTCREGHLLRKTDNASCQGPPAAVCTECYWDLTDEQWRMVERLRRKMYSLLARGYAFHHCPCPLLGRQIESLGASPKSVEVFPYGVPDGLVQERRPKTASDVLRLAFVGRWNRIKGIDVLLDAMEQLDPTLPVELHLYGEQEVWNEDIYGQEIAAQAERLPNVVVRGRFSPEQVGTVHAEIDAMVVPSIWPENSPVSILEALTLGTPVICADGEGMTNLITHGQNGLVFQSRNVADLTAKIIELATSPELRERVTAGAHNLRTISQDAERFEAVYREASAQVDEVWRLEARDLVETLLFTEEVYLESTLVRRVQRVFQQLADRGLYRIALFGAGRHTLKLLGSVDIVGVDIVAILDESPDAIGSRILRVPVRP